MVQEPVDHGPTEHTPVLLFPSIYRSAFYVQMPTRALPHHLTLLSSQLPILLLKDHQTPYATRGKPGWG